VREEKIEGHGRYLRIYIYIYECKWVCAVREKKTNLLFKEKEAFGQERKNKFKQGKFLNLKVLKL